MESFDLLHIILPPLESPFRRNKGDAMAEPECCQHELKQPIPQRNGTEKAKRITQWDPCLHNQPNAPLCRHAASLSRRKDMELHDCSTNDTEDEVDIGNFASSELKLLQNDDFQLQRLKAKKHVLAILKDWKEKMEFITPPENEVHSQKHFTISPGHQMEHGQIYDEYDISDDDLVMISRPKRRSRDNLRLACPFYVYDPEKCHQCLFTSDLRNISDVIEHLFQSHSRPCYCLNCYGIFDTQICRDNHVLNETCRRRAPGPLFGLSECQKSILLETETHFTDEISQWLFIWSIVFPDSCEPRLLYLEQGTG
ncbi:hypothetical protein LB504_010509 [Fusarium proliferatum]|nr:hypothetical protein LB504_010509 [Fusarium proliferatum]